MPAGSRSDARAWRARPADRWGSAPCRGLTGCRRRGPTGKRGPPYCPLPCPPPSRPFAFFAIPPEPPPDFDPLPELEPPDCPCS